MRSSINMMIHLQNYSKNTKLVNVLSTVKPQVTDTCIKI